MRIKYLAKLFCVGLLFTITALTQTTVPIRSIGPSHVVRNISWSTNSLGAAAYYYWTPVQGSTYACVVINSFDPVNFHLFNVAGYTTVDPAAPQNVGFAFSQSTLQATFNGQSIVQAAGGDNAASFSIPDNGAAQVYVTVYGNSVTGGTYDFLEYDSTTPCLNNSLSTAISASLNSPQGTRPCLLTAFGQVASGSNQVIATAQTVPPANSGNVAQSNSPRWHICSYTITGATGTTSTQIGFLVGVSASSCTAATFGAGNSWVITSPVGIPNYSLTGNPDVFTMNSAGNALCYRDGGTTTGTTFSVSYDLY